MDETIVAYRYDPETLIHHFKIQEKTRRAVDHYVDYMYKIAKEFLEANLEAPTLRIMIDITDSGMFPLRYLYDRMREFLRKNAHIPPAYIAYIAIQTDDLVLLRSVSASRAKDTRGVFLPTEIDKATEWLTSQTS